jgi:Ran GTPase-activating protein (RanGAP) involved in mRNA processing and transport
MEIALGDEGAKWISKAIENNSVLKAIDLSWNLIGIEGSKWLSKAIVQNSTLLKINLEGNLIESRGAKYFAQAIKHNSKLKEINLGSNYIHTEGAIYISKAIKHNSSLLKINLSRNYIREEGARWIAEAIERKSSYFSFFVQILEFENPFRKRIYNSTLDVIHLSHNYIGSGLESRIAGILRENRSRRERNYRRSICAFIDNQKGKGLIRLPFDKMILRFVSHPIMGFSTKE